jgi:hypothetical protein
VRPGVFTSGNERSGPKSTPCRRSRTTHPGRPNRLHEVLLGDGMCEQAMSHAWLESSIPAHAIQKETRHPRGAVTPSTNLVTKSMSYSTSAGQTVAVATALAKLGVRPGE